MSEPTKKAVTTTVEIPNSIVTLCIRRGWTKKEAQKLYAEFIKKETDKADIAITFSDWYAETYFGEN